ncbi:PepSY-associated TM helix domain-containing protein [Candidatus Albibeggiatoa sp. nov. NOAA]|uniref:PepSY-associated TM helix domain-containing protein n=1 Tax=Candidatus Albibeggiatoa sp. nov. NOAA TaxID=3162724 RepID=UPI0032F40018|nr:PepSY-associated TM helix domain-containing protein [Thiotrichaceae bacterium]
MRFTSARFVRLLHSYTSMLMLFIMLFFTVTGITLNHREWLPESSNRQLLDIDLPSELGQTEAWQADALAQGDRVRRWLRNHYQVSGSQVRYDWDAEEQFLVIDIKRPGGYSLVEVDVIAQQLILEHHKAGLMSTLNDLHMGRYSGELWRGFIDASAVAMLLFTLTGFWLVLPQKKRRTRLLVLTVVGLGVMLGAYSFM